ncbi:MAG: hypothetical protein CYPHOPRED_002328 [Cyphobasidiales sp. Tagirdzhanova-0007]|nr:MAG: hypothetical protein CYPHOPRED_002328 [Cyphobasidiales sp. Tagirdzhanova-0007]
MGPCNGSREPPQAELDFNGQASSGPNTPYRSRTMPDVSVSSEAIKRCSGTNHEMSGFPPSQNHTIPTKSSLQASPPHVFATENTNSRRHDPQGEVATEYPSRLAALPAARYAFQQKPVPDTATLSAAGASLAASAAKAVTGPNRVINLPIRSHPPTRARAQRELAGKSIPHSAPYGERRQEHSSPKAVSKPEPTYYPSSNDKHTYLRPQVVAATKNLQPAQFDMPNNTIPKPPAVVEAMALSNTETLLPFGTDVRIRPFTETKNVAARAAASAYQKPATSAAGPAGKHINSTAAHAAASAYRSDPQTRNPLENVNPATITRGHPSAAPLAASVAYAAASAPYVATPAINRNNKVHNPQFSSPATKAISYNGNPLVRGSSHRPPVNPSATDNPKISRNSARRHVDPRHVEDLGDTAPRSSPHQTPHNARHKPESAIERDSANQLHANREHPNAQGVRKKILGAW